VKLSPEVHFTKNVSVACFQAAKKYKRKFLAQNFTNIVYAAFSCGKKIQNQTVSRKKLLKYFCTKNLLEKVDEIATCGKFHQL